MDALLLSRIQFGFVMSFHILFPALTIGLASWLVFVEAAWLRTHQQVWLELYFFWLRIFAVAFGMGVVSGIVMSFQFGTNWAELSIRAGNILGPLLSYEVLTAFFLEASFLGVMLFGHRKVSPGLHFFATCMVALGTLISTFWILSANSWMQTPAGFEIVTGADGVGIFHPIDWWAAIFNPSFPYRLAHMVLAAFITTCFVIGGVSAMYLRRGRHLDGARRMLRLAVLFAAIAVPLQIVAGDLHGLNVRQYQPAKLAAMEAHWDTGRGIPLILFAWPDAANENNAYALAVPKLGSLILTHALDGEVRGLKDFARADRPPVAPVFFAFRVMVGLGLVMLGVVAWSLLAWWRGRLYDARWLLRAWTWSWPSGFIALLAGWYTAEIGRQPWVVYGLLRTADAGSAVGAGAVMTSLATFAVVYVFVFGMGGWYLIKLVRTGPQPIAVAHDDDKSAARPLSVPDEPLEE